MYDHIGLLLFIITLIRTIAAYDYKVIDLSDILNADYMPGNLLMLENPKEDRNNSHINDNANFTVRRGTFDSAFATMGFHRKMMNEYLCRNYISEQIITEMKSTRLRRRAGSSAKEPAAQNSQITSLPLQNTLIDDEGSSGYQDWLKKSATLEDIYRHYESAQNKESPVNVNENDEPEEEYDPHIAGVSHQKNHNQISFPSKPGHSSTSSGYPYSGYSSNAHIGGYGIGAYGAGTSGQSGYGLAGSAFTGHENYGDGYQGQQHLQQDYNSHEYVPKHYGEDDGKDKLYDLFEIALTALAYLSFGMFIIQVIMCITMAGTTSTMMTMMPMSMNPTEMEPTGEDNGGTDTAEGGTEDAGDADNGRLPDYYRIRNRHQRSISSTTEANNQALNELARRVLISIEAALIANQDDGLCLQKSLCDNNAYSRDLKTSQRYWLPVWSLGMSWLSGRLVNNVPKLTSMLDSLKASLLGLGKANCEFIYSNCNLLKRRQIRRRRRK